jgi:thiol-disulfide isomerase/thioredoxin
MPGPLALVLIAAIAWFWFRPPAWVRMAQLRGRVVLVNFWATWCPYCRHEMPAIQAFFDDYRGRGFTVLALSVDDSEAAARSYLKDHRYSFPAGMSHALLASAFGGVDRLPTSFVIDKKGMIRHKISGQVHYARMKKLVEPLLEE